LSWEARHGRAHVLLSLVCLLASRRRRRAVQATPVLHLPVTAPNAQPKDIQEVPSPSSCGVVECRTVRRKRNTVCLTRPVSHHPMDGTVTNGEILLKLQISWYLYATRWPRCLSTNRRENSPQLNRESPPGKLVAIEQGTAAGITPRRDCYRGRDWTGNTYINIKHLLI
jgi:hypothetical protein